MNQPTTLSEWKAAAYDTLAAMERLQLQLKEINAKIVELSKEVKDEATPGLDS